ncbi:MAG: hypothetical protein HY553_05495 [Elusimicrobia bacterium]|nr:hypothetical protein [Elusimicrobiota bacterium]
MERTLAVLNELVRDRVIEKYAIGGAMAAVFYAEPVPTYDLDVFVLLAPPQGPIVSLRPIYEYLRQKGFKESKEHVLVEGIPVQFIPAYNALVEEAVEKAGSKAYGERRTRVIRPEYLMAIMLQTGRSKDKLRIAQFLESVAYDKNALRDILKRHGLSAAWEKFLRGLGA